MKRSKLLYFTILLSSLIFIYFYGGKVPYMLFYTVILLPAFSFLYTFLISVRFKYSQELDRSVILKGEKVDFTCTFYNEDFILYPYIHVIFPGASLNSSGKPNEIKFSLAPRKKKSYTFELKFDYRGIYEVGIDVIRFEDFLGLFRFKYKVPDRKKITVNPRIIELDNLSLRSTLASESRPVKNNVNEDNMSVCDIREYQYGDSIKKIHWKLTSKSEELLVKQFESSSEMSTVLLIDLVPCEPAGDNKIIIEDKIIEAAVAIVHYCLKNWININLLYYNNNLVSINATNNLMFPSIYKTLASVNFNQRVPAGTILDMRINNSIAKTNILLLTSNLDYELCEKLIKAGNGGYDTCLVYISPDQLPGLAGKDEDNIMKFLRENGIFVLKIQINDDIKTSLESLNGLY